HVSSLLEKDCTTPCISSSRSPAGRTSRPKRTGGVSQRRSRTSRATRPLEPPLTAAPPPAPVAALPARGASSCSPARPGAATGIEGGRPSRRGREQRRLEVELKD